MRLGACRCHRKTHPEARRAFKACNLGVVYGARPRRIAAQLGVSESAAVGFYEAHRLQFARTHAFCERVIATAEEDRVTVLQDGWRKRIPAPFRPTTAANFPIQGTAALILRQAVLGFYAAGLPLLAPVHDAALFEVTLGEAADLIATASRIMTEAGAWFVPGLALKVDVSTSVPIPGIPDLDSEDRRLASGGRWRLTTSTSHSPGKRYRGRRQHEGVCA